MENKNYFTLSMKRSGHHAVMNWIMSNMEENFIFYNSCFIENGEVVPMGRNNVTVYDKKNQQTNYRKKGTDFKIIEENNPHITAKMYNFEDYYTTILDDKLIDGTKIVVMRDIYNMIASSIKQNEKKYGDKVKLKDRIDRWLSHTQIVEDEGIIFINYNKWFSDNNYRNEISVLLNFTNKDVGMNYIPHFGKGSSFDLQNKKGKDMLVLERYKSLSEVYIKEIKNHERFNEINYLNKSIFGMDYNKIFK
jgi:hypothetical protein